MTKFKTTKRYFGFTRKEYEKYIRKLGEFYHNNKHASINSIAKTEQSKGIQISRQRLWYAFKMFDIPLKKKSYIENAGYKVLRVLVNKEDYQWFMNLDKEYGNYRIRRNYLLFAIDLLKGNPTPHGLLFLDKTKPVIFLYDFKYDKWIVFGENLSQFEESKMTKLVQYVYEFNNLTPVERFAHKNNLVFLGNTQSMDPDETT